MDAGFSKIIDRISETLNFFDFSFIVSGLLTYGIILFTADSIISVDYKNYNSGVIVVVSIALVYICGLMSFSVGKFLRIKILSAFNENYFNDVFKKALKFINSKPYEKNDEITIYLSKDRGSYKTIYSKMWMELRHCEEAKETVRHLNRFWMMEAVYEGLFVSFILGAVSSIYFLCVNWCNDSRLFYGMTLVLSLIATVFCFIEARRYAETQIVEIVLTYKRFIAV